MKITILGSGAAEAIPNPYCQCPVCTTARIKRAKHIRARSAAIVNDDLLIDLGPDLISNANHWDVYLGNVETLLVTHRHEDHWLPQNLMWRRNGFAPTLETQLTIYAPSDVLVNLPATLGEQAKMSWHSISGGQQWTAGQYTITAIPATHGLGLLEGVLYVIDDGNHRLFYATDTAPLSERAWDILRPLGSMDLVLLDSTMGPLDGGEARHGIPQFLNTRNMMIEKGAVVPTTTILAAHHISHNGGLTHDDLVEIYSPHNVQVSYDGWVVNL